MKKLEELKELEFDDKGKLFLDKKPIKAKPLGNEFYVGFDEQIPFWLELNGIPREANAYAKQLVLESKGTQETMYLVQAYQIN